MVARAEGTWLRATQSGPRGEGAPARGASPRGVGGATDSHARVADVTVGVLSSLMLLWGVSEGKGGLVVGGVEGGTGAEDEGRSKGGGRAAGGRRC